MNKFSWVIIGLFSIVLFQFIDIQAQNFQKKVTIPWSETLSYEYSDENKIELLYFNGAIASSEIQELPSYFEKIPIDVFYDNYEVSISGEQYEKMTTHEASLIPSLFESNKLKINVKSVVEKKRNYMVITFVPIRKVGTNSYEKLISADISIKGLNTKRVPNRTKSYAAHSVLASGNWYKIAVSETGMFKVTYEDFTVLGIGGGNWPSSQIALFGNGGGMLPEANGIVRHDDLTEIPILMFDGGDNTFNAGDYFVFYAQGPHSWSYNETTQQFNHSFNLYSDYAYYFINVDGGVGSKKRITITDNSSLSPSAVANTFTHYGFYEVDQVNIGEAGRNWFGDKFDATTSYNYSFTIPPATGTRSRITLSAAAMSVRNSNFAISVNGQFLGNAVVSGLAGSDIAESVTREFNFSPNGNSMNVALSYSKPTSSSTGFLNYLEWQTEGLLQMYAAQFPFCNKENIANNTVTQFSIANADANVRVWDVTNATAPVQMQGALSGNNFTFNAVTDTLRRFVAFNGTSFYSVTNIGRIDNQNLHGSSQVDMIIVTYPDFKSQADRLAAYRAEKDGLSVKVVTPIQVYNEFSSGTQDVSAIRDYMKMIYEKSGGVYPKYLLLMGRPSYDYRGRENTCLLYVPNYQSASVMNESSLRSNDDYFALLDDDEGANCVGFLDISVGRFPVTTLSQAQIAVNKSINYSTTEILGEDQPLTSNFGDWKNMAAFVADDEDGTTHIRAADLAATLAGNSNSIINLDKIYLDAYQQVSYSASQRYPDVTAAINHRMNAGCLLFTYVGHGGKNGWATERIIELTDISRWSNRYNQPWMITLTCEFGWYDRALVSPAEMVFLNANGGASGMVTTSRVAFTGSNEQYASAFYSNIFIEDNNVPKTIGEINRIAKNNSGGANNTLNMIYVMGDPSMKLAIPRYNIVTDSINGRSVSDEIDTMKALSRVSIVGHIADDLGNVLQDFSGGLYPSVYDKKVVNHTLQNDVGSNYFEFDVQKNILFKGNVTVKNGRFNFSFLIPKDINYAYDEGKISYYAYSRSAEAAGSFNDAVIGGISDEQINDAKGPEIELFMNDESFVSGGTVNQSPTLIVKLKDEYGINTTGNGIGHDLVAIMDDEKQLVLNTYYEAERDSFNCGKVRYPYEKLAVGSHKIKVRAWDILNNVSEQTIEFVVASDEELTIDHVLNYPNPFTTNTSFYFEHNQPGVVLDVMISIFTISGKLIKTIETTELSDGYRSSPISWNGRDDFGDKLAKGTYLYRLKVRTPDGQSAEKIEKIVIL